MLYKPLFLDAIILNSRVYVAFSFKECRKMFGMH